MGIQVKDHVFFQGEIITKDRKYIDKIKKTQKTSFSILLAIVMMNLFLRWVMWPMGHLFKYTD